jgi:hypothetical protein
VVPGAGRDGLGEVPGFERTGCALVVETDLKPTVITLHDLSEQPANSRIIPGLFPGLFAAKSGLLP